MFVRLFLAFVLFAVLAAALAGVLTGGGDGLGRLAALLLVGLAAVGPAWLLARMFVRPVREIRAAAERVARGEPGQRVHGGRWRETRELADTLDAMSRALADQIDRLDAERRHLRAVLGGMAEGVVAVGPGQRVLFANGAAGQVLDFDPAQATGRPLYKLTRQPGVLTLLDRARATGQPQREPVEFQKPSARHLVVYVAPLAGADGPGAVIVLDDTSEVRRLERVRQEFVANVSHELKTPLAVIRACVEALQDGAVEDPAARGPFLQQIADGADRLHALILDLLSLARIESGDDIFEFAAVPVRELVADCLDRHRPRAEAKGMTLAGVPPPADVFAWADAEAVGQILDNLVDNAVKYTPEGGTVRVSWSADADRVILQVEDNGPGIPERDLARVFERFYRVDRARSRELGGTGLGLSIVKHLAQAMNGSVKADSQLGRGTTFTVALPRAAGEGL